ncbi:MAG: flagellar hook-associated protein FlgK [Paracoccaceae bacterium]|jgi:flagellar hook-associated protein 1|nr:flagellar hook-associated protein FlgK [Paracoccaceae bacterium]
MSIAGALSNALSGLTAASRSAEVVASNIANAATEGYATRSLVTSSRQGTTGGVRIDGIARASDPALLADRRLATAEQTREGGMATAMHRVEALFGTPLDPGSLTARVTAFETALIEASSRPDLAERLDRAVNMADGLAGKFREISAGLQQIRTAADGDIARQVTTLNTDLERVAELNKRITALASKDVGVAPLLDERQVVIDRISLVVPVIEVARDRGAIALFTPGGAVLLDGPAARLGFEPANLVAPQMTQAGGLLSGLTVNGVPVSTDPQFGPLAGGGLDAAFRIRDDLAVRAQAQLDAMARDLATRFVDPAIDPTLQPMDPGLFTDAGAAVDPALEAGLAGRIRLNAVIDPRQGDNSWRLRDGLGAALPGPPGEAGLLNRALTALQELRNPGSPVLDPVPQSLSDMAARVISDVGSSRQMIDQRQSFASVRAMALQAAEREAGVDSDDQLQRLLLIEQAYAANARVIQAVDDMLDSLLRI